jgi:hypothetical protein
MRTIVANATGPTNVPQDGLPPVMSLTFQYWVWPYSSQVTRADSPRDGIHRVRLHDLGIVARRPRCHYSSYRSKLWPYDQATWVASTQQYEIR